MYQNFLVDLPLHHHCCCLMRSASLFVLIETARRMIQPMNVQPRRKDRIKIGHFLSVLFRRAGNIRSTTKGKLMMTERRAVINPALRSSLAIPKSIIPRAQRIAGMEATANMMKFVWVFLSCFFQVSFRFCLLVGKFHQF